MRLRVCEDRLGRKVNREIDIDPATVFSLCEGIRKSKGKVYQVAIVRLKDGQRFTVLDPGRELYWAVRRINEAQAL